jgi:hypothetical protein
VQVFVGAIGGLVFVPFLVGLRNVVRRSDGETGTLAATILVAGAAGATVGFAEAAIPATLAYASKHGGADPSLVKSLVDLDAMLSPNLILFPLGLVIGTVAYAALVHGALPRWVGFAGAAVTAGCLLGAMGLFVDSGALRTGGGFIPVLRVSILAWVVATSVAMLRGARLGEAPDGEARRRRERHRQDRQVQQGQPEPA